MNRYLPFLLALLVADLAVAEGSNDQHSLQETNSIKMVFCPKGQLTATDVQSLLQLARRMDIYEVDEITTYYMHPGTNVAIRVTAKEVRTNDKIKVRSFHAWTLQSRTPRSNEIVVGNFWTDAVDQYTLTEFYISGKPYRITLDETIPKEVAQEMLTAVINRKWQARDPNPKLEKILKSINEDFTLTALHSSLTCPYPGVTPRKGNPDEYCVRLGRPLQSYSFWFTINDGVIMISNWYGLIS